jgi:G:T-mismatch repair DNA endonuclease (very short patch repair protein)
MHFLIRWSFTTENHFYSTFPCYILDLAKKDEELSKGWGQIVPTLLQSRFLDKTLPGKPNRVLPKYKVAFIVNGFWARAQRPKVCYTAYYPLLS